MAEIKAVIGSLPTYGYRRVHAILKRQALAAGLNKLARIAWSVLARGRAFEASKLQAA